MNYFEKICNKILDKEGLEKWLDDCRKNGKKIVFSNGCFDILHRGHAFEAGKDKRSSLFIVYRA